MTWLAYGVVLVPLALYIVLFSYEAVLSLLRISPSYQRRTQDNGYVHATWEITHTLLVFSFTSFFVLFSPVIVEVAEAAFVPIFLTGAAFALRGILYLYLFYIADQSRKRRVLDILFAFAHLVIIGALAWATTSVVQLLSTNPAQPNLELLPITAPPVLLVIAFSALPLVRLYRSRHTS